MMQQDLTAPVDRVKVSRREAFRRSYELFQDDDTPEDLTGYVFSGVLTDRTGSQKLTLTESSGITRPETNAVALMLNTIQMSELTPGEYRLRLSGLRAGERDEFVIIILEVE